MILVIGGSGSGKSAYAEKVALECQKEKRHFYLATMHVFGEEGQKKVERHKRMRAGKGFVTIEQPTDIMQCLPALREAGGGVVLLECMSNLAANEMFDTEEPAGRSRKRLSRRLACWRRRRKNLSLSPTMCLRMASSMILPPWNIFGRSAASM